jgi:flagellar biosynthesis/type III secretory pathway chaperone
MITISPIKEQPEAVLELLIAQCADLEALLELARAEQAALEQGDFEEVFRVVEERASLGERLEVYHRQIAQLRLTLGEAAEPALQSAPGAQAMRLVQEILALDAGTRPQLLAARERIIGESRELEKMRRGLSAYLPDGRRSALAYDRRV